METESLLVNEKVELDRELWELLNSLTTEEFLACWNDYTGHLSEGNICEIIDRMDLEELKDFYGFVVDWKTDKKEIKITKKDTEPYGDDLRAIIRAFADKIFDKDNKKNLELLKEEIEFILNYEIGGDENDNSNL